MGGVDVEDGKIVDSIARNHLQHEPAAATLLAARLGSSNVATHVKALGDDENAAVVAALRQADFGTSVCSCREAKHEPLQLVLDEVGQKQQG